VNISGTDKDSPSQIGKLTDRSFGEKSPINFGPVIIKFAMWLWTHQNRLFLRTLFWPIRGAAFWKFCTR